MAMRRSVRATYSLLPHQSQLIFRNCLVIARHLGLHIDDIILASFPKSGSTWLRFLIVGIIMDMDVDFDNVDALSPPVGAHHTRRTARDPKRIIKSHEVSKYTLRKHAKAIYVVRDGRDVALSYYRHFRRQGAKIGTFKTFLQEFLQGQVGPYGAWHVHVLSWYYAKSLRPENVIILRYEDAVVNPIAVVRKCMQFAEISVSEERIRAAVAKNSRDQMRKKEARSEFLASESLDQSVPFVSISHNNDWRDYFDEEDVKLFQHTAGDALQIAGYDH